MNEPRRVPIVLQVDPDECAAACLAMVLGAFGLPGDLAACRQRLRPGPKGVDAASLAAAAREAGLAVRAYDARGRAAFEALPLPAIVHWRLMSGRGSANEVSPGERPSGEHFVVLERRSALGVRIVDPARGRRRLRWRSLLESSAGAVLTFAREDRSPGAAWVDAAVSCRPGPMTLLTVRAVRLPVVGALGIGLLLAVAGAAVLGFVDHLAASPWPAAGAACLLWAVGVWLRARLVDAAGRYLDGALALDASRARSVFAEQVARLDRRTIVASRLAARLRATVSRLVCRGSFDLGGCVAILALLSVRSPRLGLLIGLGIAAWLGLGALGRRRLPGGTLRGVPRGERASLRAVDLLQRLAADDLPMRGGLRVLRGLGVAVGVTAVVGVAVGDVSWIPGLGREPALIDGLYAAVVVSLAGRLADALRRLRFVEPGGLALATAIDQDTAS